MGVVDLKNTIFNTITYWFENLFDQFIKFFADILGNIMSTSEAVLKLPLVENGVAYTQALAFALLTLKVINEAFQTYILYQNGDPEADTSGLVIRTAQSAIVIGGLPWIVTEIFEFGNKLVSDISGLSSGKAGVEDWAFITHATASSFGLIVALFGIILVIMLLIVSIQATIRGAELALMTVLGPIMALNLTANNRSIWASWFRQVIIICCTQAIQIFMISGALSLMTNNIISNQGLFLVFGWLWVTIKSPQYIKQLAYSTGLTSAIGGVAKQSGSMAVMRLMLRK